MNKRAQFFLLAALIMTLVMISLATITTLARSPPEDLSVFDLSKELAYESTQILDHGIFNALSGAALQQRITNLSDHYATLHKNTDFLIIYGDELTLKTFHYTRKPTGKVGIDTGTGTATGHALTRPTANIITDIEQDGKHIKVVLPNQRQVEFDLNPGQNFFIVMEKSGAGQRIVTTAGSGPVNITKGT